MSEIINIFALNPKNNEADVSELKQKLTDNGIEYSCLEFDSAENLAAAVASSSGNVLACCSKEDFSATKLAVINSISRRVGKSASIIAAMDCNAPDEQSEYNIHTALPEGGKAYPSSDGMFSGFSCPTDNGMLFFAPFDSTIVASVLDGGMMEALKKASDPIQQKSAVEEFRECVEGIIGNEKTIAIAGAGSFKPLVSAISSVPGWEKVFIPDSTVAERTSKETDEEYIARCAKESKEACNADLGISISDITDGEDGKYIAVSVADSKRAKGAKVFSKGDSEDPKMLISASVIKLCEMLDELSVSGISEEEIPVKKKSGLPFLIILIALVATMVVCGFIAIKSFASRDKHSTSLAQEVIATVQNDEDTFNTAGGVGLNENETIDESTTVDFSEVISSTAAEKSSTAKETSKVASIVTTVKQIVSTTILATKPTTTVATTTAPVKTTAAATSAKESTKASSSTAAATTAKPVTTTKAAEAGTKNSSSTGGKWVFRVYGWGHGVGMSQEGAIAMAKNGSSYVEILENYYSGCTIKTDSNTPKTVTYGGKAIPIVEYLCRTAYAEIGSPATEALKAQIVCAYTYAKYYKFNIASSKHAYKASFEYKNTNVYKAVLAVLGMSSDSDTPKAKYVDYNGSTAFTCYFDCSAGKTTSSSSVWGGSDYPYLRGGNVSPETVKITTVEISVADMKNYIQSYAKEIGKTINLGSDPETWLTIVSHDSAVNNTTGYVDYIMIGDYKVRGNTFRCNVLDFKIRSHCFSMEYVA